MEGFVKGDVIVIEFPYSHLKEFKRRPVLILKVPKGEDIIVLQITSSSYEKSVEIPIKKEDFHKGGLKRDSFTRVDKIASVEKSLINRWAQGPVRTLVHEPHSHSYKYKVAILVITVYY